MCVALACSPPRPGTARRCSASGIFGGLLIPPLARALSTGSSPRRDRADDAGAAARRFRRRPRPSAPAAAAGRHRRVPAPGLPVLAWAAVARLPGSTPAIAAGVVIFATGCAGHLLPAFARLVGLDPELTLLATLATTLLVPLTAPPLASRLTGVDLAIGCRRLHGAAGAGGRRCRCALSLLLRRVARAARGWPARAGGRWRGGLAAWCSTASA